MTDAFKHFEQIFRLLQANSNVRFKTVDQKQNENTHTHKNVENVRVHQTTKYISYQNIDNN